MGIWTRWQAQRPPGVATAWVRLLWLVTPVHPCVAVKKCQQSNVQRDIELIICYIASSRNMAAPKVAPHGSAEFKRDWRRACQSPAQRWAYLQLCCIDGPQVMSVTMQVNDGGLF